MKKNMSNTDRLIRLALIISIVALYFLNIIGGTLAIILLVVGGILLMTTIFNFCPLYRIIGVSTCKV